MINKRKDRRAQIKKNDRGWVVSLHAENQETLMWSKVEEYGPTSLEEARLIKEEWIHGIDSFRNLTK